MCVFNRVNQTTYLYTYRCDDTRTTMLMSQYLVVVAPLMVLYHITATCSSVYFHLTNHNVIHQIYRSIVCSMVSLGSFLCTIVYWHSSPFATSPGINAINQTMIGFLAWDMCLMAYHRNTRVELWGHHAFCLATYVLMVEYFGQSNLLLAMMSMGESLSVLSGVDAVVDAGVDTNMNHHRIITNMYRMAIIILVRFPLWLYLAKMTLHPESPPAVRVNCAIGVYCMVVMDAYWYKRCHRYLVKHKFTQS